MASECVACRSSTRYMCGEGDSIVFFAWPGRRFGRNIEGAMLYFIVDPTEIFAENTKKDQLHTAEKQD